MVNMKLPINDNLAGETSLEADDLTTSIFEVAADIESIAEMMSELIIWPEALAQDSRRENQTWH